MDWFLVLLIVTTIIRGMGAGMIYDAALVSLPVRHQIGVIPYANFARANFMGNGVRTYAPVSIIGALLTIVATVFTFILQKPVIVNWSITISMIATVLAFLGTSQALPAVMSLRDSPNDESLVSQILDRFARWHTFSTLWQVVSFLALVVALATNHL